MRDGGRSGRLSICPRFVRCYARRVPLATSPFSVSGSRTERIQQHLRVMMQWRLIWRQAEVHDHDVPTSTFLTDTCHGTRPHLCGGPRRRAHHGVNQGSAQVRALYYST